MGYASHCKLIWLSLPLIRPHLENDAVTNKLQVCIPANGTKQWGNKAHYQRPILLFHMEQALKINYLITRNEVGARLYFHRRLWFCPRVCSRGGCLLPGGGAWSRRGCAWSRGGAWSGGSWWRPPPPLSPPPGTATAVGSTHPTGMHSCLC